MEEDADALAMAQAMGFSAFGSQDPPAKKRRYNPHSDASLPASLPSKPRTSASGANSAPLGPPRSTSNNEEISLDDDEELQETGIEETGLASIPQRPAAAAAAAGEAGEEQGRGKQGHGQGRGGRGQFNPLWYENYYDPSSNANPWDRIEKKLNLQPRDTWPAREFSSLYSATRQQTKTERKR
jgi:hypothetical protein